MKHHACLTLAPDPQTYSIESENNATSFELVDQYTDRLGIDEIRNLIEEAHRQPFDGFDKKLIVIRAGLITAEAQQAALKILEEPPIKTKIHLVLPSGANVLPTVLSRVWLEKAPIESSLKVFQEWLAGSYSERLEMVTERTKAKDLEWIRALKLELQAYVAEQSDLTASQLETVSFVLQNLLGRGSSNKMLLEHLAMALPLTTKSKQ